ncbi:MAG TPA: NAD-dependent epimerase/dehydratase family protein [Acidimicrobiales bacterium]|nr:NAD-dependent epimerase/dehydratase family protein [Acidimicrobiales bacterium]
MGNTMVVAGAGGFIGGHLVAKLLESGATDVRAVDVKPLDEWLQVHAGAENVSADLSEKVHAYSALEGAGSVFALASDMGGIGFIEQNKALCMLSSLITTHLLMAARDHEVERFFYASSACVYAADKQSDPDVTALRESDAYPAMPEDGYGWEKLFSERMCRHFLEDFGVQTRVARYHNVFGPYGTWAGGREKAPAAICRKVIQAQLDGTEEIEIWGDGEQTRSFMYIDDCLKGTLELAASDVAQPVNLGSAELVTINRLVDLVEKIAGTSLRRNYNLSAPQGVRGRNSDNTLINSLLGWEPSLPLEVGLEATYRWIYDQMTA